MQSIKCGHCHTYHRTSREVYFCQAGPRGQRMAPPLAANVKAYQPSNPRPKGWPLSTPKELVLGIREGRYAARPDDTKPFTFVRVSRPKTGKLKGCFVVQTQHSESYFKRVVIYPSGHWWVDETSITRKAALDEALLLIAVDEVGCAINYGTELGQCSRCGKKLTDERSRWYSIGPECEKHWEDLIEEIESRKGAYVPGRG